MDSFDWLEQLHREAWTARIRQLRPQLREERETCACRNSSRPIKQSKIPYSNANERLDNPEGRHNSDRGELLCRCGSKAIVLHHR